MRYIIFVFMLVFCPAILFAQDYNIQVKTEIDLGQKIEQFRAVPVTIGEDIPNAVVAMYSEDAEIDPNLGMFFFPEHTLKLAVFNVDGTILWKKDLGKGVIPGVWFSPVAAFDLDQDGLDEVWNVNTTDPGHPLDHRAFVLEKRDAKTGEVKGQWKWPEPYPQQEMSRLFRHFIMGGYVNGEPVLITANGTKNYETIKCWNSDLSERWVYKKTPDTPGCQGSHMSPVVDINNDGVDELLWGERCIELDKGKMLFCADEETWNGHSDIIEPVTDTKTGKWFFFTCRESNSKNPPRVVLFDEKGQRVWSKLDEGHIDTGWAARIGKNGEPVVLGVKIGEKKRSAEGEHRVDVEEITFDAFSGEKIDLGFSVYTTIPVDVNGDGIHELVKGYFEGDGTLLDNKGNIIGNIGGASAIASKFTGDPGEQILSYSKNGIIRIWVDKSAQDNKIAKKRYSNPAYKLNQKQTGNGYNLFNLGGI